MAPVYLIFWRYGTRRWSLHYLLNLFEFLMMKKLFQKKFKRFWLSPDFCFCYLSHFISLTMNGFLFNLVLLAASIHNPPQIILTTPRICFSLFSTFPCLKDVLSQKGLYRTNILQKWRDTEEIQFVLSPETNLFFKNFQVIAWSELD